MSRLDALLDLVAKHIDSERTKQAERYNRGRKDVRFDIGDQVLRRTHKLSSAIDKFNAKLAPKYEGPYRVAEELSPTVYVLEKGDSSAHKVLKVHVSDLKRYLPPRGVAAVTRMDVAQRESGNIVNVVVKCRKIINLIIFRFRLNMSENHSQTALTVQEAGVEAAVQAVGMPVPLGSTAATTEARIEHLRATALRQTMLQSVRSVQAEPGKLLVSFELPREAPTAAMGALEEATLSVLSRQQSWQRWESQRAVEELSSYLSNQETGGAPGSTVEEVMIIDGLEESILPATVTSSATSAPPLKKRKRSRKGKGPRQWTLKNHYSWDPEAVEEDDEPLAVSRRVESVPLVMHERESTPEDTWDDEPAEAPWP